MYSNNYQALNSAGNGYNCVLTYVRILTFCVTAIIYYIIVNLAYAFIKSKNMIYHYSVYQGPVHNIDQLCQGHSLIPEFLKCAIMYQLKFMIVTNIVSNI